MKQLVVVVTLVALLGVSAISAEFCSSANRSVSIYRDFNETQWLNEMAQIYAEAETKAIGNAESPRCFVWLNWRWSMYLARRADSYPVVKPFYRLPCPFSTNASSANEIVKVELPAFWI